ncbi:MAG TPA: ABC transporter ATP-binding protein [Candidatus Saccharimonadales bacterium]|nr:ABC transporter ATP-binding protein [Candidatus Saccharimonadales bacterium]
MIHIRNVTKTYGRRQNRFVAIDDISFDVPEGTSVAIMGKSGSGKSTLMHAISGLDRPQKGQVIIGDKDILQLHGHELDRFRANEMGFIFQSFFVEGNASCYHNVALPLEIARLRPWKRKKLILEALEKVEMSDKVHAPARDLSGGQKQRLAIARAIVNSPKLIFADEPTGNLDSGTGERIMDLLFDLNRKMGSTLFIVTHDADLANRCKLRIHVKDGRIVSMAGQTKKEKQS